MALDMARGMEKDQHYADRATVEFVERYATQQNVSGSPGGTNKNSQSCMRDGCWMTCFVPVEFYGMRYRGSSITAKTHMLPTNVFHRPTFGSESLIARVSQIVTLPT